MRSEHISSYQKSAEALQQNAQKKLIYAILMMLVSLLTVFFKMLYAKKWVFEPLIIARKQFLKLAQADSVLLAESASSKHDDSIFDAIRRLQKKLQQCEALEFQLRHM